MKTQKETEKKKISKYIPSLRLRYRIFLYFVTIVCIALALVNVVFASFPNLAGILFYVLAAVTVTASCYYIMIHIRQDIRETIKPAIAANPYTNKVTTDYRWRTILFAVPGMVSNMIFAAFNGVIGITSHSAWFGTLSAYYILLSIMRAGIVRHEREIAALKEKQEHMRRELSVYRKNSVLFLFMAVVLAGAVILLLNAQGGKDYPGLTIYAVATYTFYKIIMSTVQVIKVGKRKSPLLSIARKIGYIDACVSILTLQTAMFASFAEGEEALIKLMNGITGTVVCLIVLGLGIQGICFSKKKSDL
ncbi:hypothetical protein ACTQ50_19085 [Blautia sp. Sow4_E7]|uniref:hypothetical protein n=1 Tax=Blautia sp. Sow4_E7 TaxID=3438749 RepID=UPI003F8E1880